MFLTIYSLPQVFAPRNTYTITEESAIVKNTDAILLKIVRLIAQFIVEEKLRIIALLVTIFLSSNYDFLLR